MGDRYASVVEAVLDADDPTIRYKARRYLAGTDPGSEAMQRLRQEIRRAPVAQGLLADLAMSNPDAREGMATISLTMLYLAEIEYSTGDDNLVPYRDQIYA